jgi:hypothetical protein
LTTTAATILALAALGVAAGFAWSAVAPTSQYVLTDAGPQLADPETQSLIAADGWFALITGGLGLVCGAVAYVVARRHPIAALLGLTGGGLLAAYITLNVGTSAKGTIQAAAPGGMTTTDFLGVTAHGVLLAWPILATGVFWLIEFVVAYRERHVGWGG